MIVSYCALRNPWYSMEKNVRSMNNRKKAVNGSEPAYGGGAENVNPRQVTEVVA